MCDKLYLGCLRARARELRDLGDRLWRTFRERLVGLRTTAVISTKRAGDRLTGFTDQAVPIELEGSSAWMGKLARIRLDALTTGGMTATLEDAAVLQ